MPEQLKAPFPFFGGKGRDEVVDAVWAAFDPRINNYIEPFCGSAAILLRRPGGAGKIETINDLDRYVANFWRAIKADPWAVAEWCDDPVNEADLHARHKWLVNQTEFRKRMHGDPHFYDVKIAGWWVWGICQWIGGGWCVEPQNKKHPKLDGIGKGVHSDKGSKQKQQLPALGVGTAEGVGTGGRGVHSAANVKSAYSPGRRPQLSTAGQGVHLPSLGNDKGIHGVSTQPGTFLHALRTLQVPDAPPCFEWFKALALRFRRVRVACGDWPRVVRPSVLGKGKNVGGRRPCAVFLDPPYDPVLRARHLYGEESTEALSAKVRQWALANGDDPDLRIALCGYAGEHEMPESWRCVAWKGNRGYAGEDNDNRSRERIWFSPHCITPKQPLTLFDRSPP